MVEVQIDDDARTSNWTLTANRKNGALYGRIAPPVAPVDSWNHVRVLVIDDYIQVSFNGEASTGRVRPDGSAFRWNGGDVHFRNIRVREITKRTCGCANSIHSASDA